MACCFGSRSWWTWFLNTCLAHNMKHTYRLGKFEKRRWHGTKLTEDYEFPLNMRTKNVSGYLVVMLLVSRQNFQTKARLCCFLVTFNVHWNMSNEYINNVYWWEFWTVSFVSSLRRKKLFLENFQEQRSKDCIDGCASPYNTIIIF